MFFFLPVGVDYAARRYPAVTFVLLGANAVFYAISLLLWLGNPTEMDPLVTHLGLVPAQRTWFTWISYLFVHADLFHFGGNMVYLFLFGACVEDLIGRGRFTAFFLLSGLLAGLTQVVFTTELGSEIPIVGASGAIAACLGAFVVALPRTRINFRYFGWFFRPFAGEFWLPSWIVISIWFGLDLLSLIADLSSAEGGGGIAFAAHVGGTIVGALTMGILRRSFRGEDAEQLPARAPVGRVVATTAPARMSPAEPATIYLNLQDPPVGPFAPSKVREMLDVGSITAETLYWQDGMPEWRPVSEL
jgi:membrane associated rhomboid family serine protease